MVRAVELRNVSVQYRIPKQRILTIKEYTIHWLKRRIEYQEFWALRNINLAVARGEVLGIIGRNGAGKSTLLKVIARVLKPTTGEVFVHGRVAPLLEITAGFDPELTGRENIYLNGAILGLSKKEMDRRFDAIVEFSEISDFIDAPVRTYSSGMMARLGFAIATDADPDILLVDEVLAVGDERFQAKCQDRIDRFRRNGVAIVVVSHSVDTIRGLCDRAAWLEQGELQGIGDGREIAFDYQEFLSTGTWGRSRPQYFHPDWTITRAELVRMLILACRVPLVSPTQASFKDVSPNSSYYPYIEAAFMRQAVWGDGKGIFRPTETVSRAEAVAIATRLSGYSWVRETATRFHDVDQGEWYARFVRAAEIGGFLPDGLDSEFRPFQGLTRAEAVQIAVRLAHYPAVAPAKSTFVDVPVDASYWLDVELAVANGLITTDSISDSHTSTASKAIEGERRTQSTLGTPAGS